MLHKMSILKAGFADSIQDEGRRGYAHWGIPASGAMDLRAMQYANWLVDNPINSPIIEITLKGGEYLFHQEALVAISGAKGNICLNGTKIDLHYSSRMLAAGDKLQTGSFKKGNFAYLAIAGSWQLRPSLGSYATYDLAKLGPFGGRKLKQGDEIVWDATNSPGTSKSLEEHKKPTFSDSIPIIRVLKGPEFERMHRASQVAFEKSIFQLTGEMSRMGYMATAKDLTADTYDIKSSLVLPGTVQLNTAGKLIILMRDAQTSGGYPRIAQLTEADLGRFAQLKPGTSFKFRLVEMEEAQYLNSYMAASI